MPCLILSPISRANTSNFSSFLSLANISSFHANCLTFASIDALMNPDQLISGNFFMSSLTLSGIDKVIDTILPVKKHKNVKVFKPFSLQSITDIYNNFPKKESGGILKEAMAGINKEISLLNKEKRNLNIQIKNLDMSLSTSQEAERKLQERIARLLEKEATLKERKKYHRNKRKCQKNYQKYRK